jgi:arsenate reductase
MKASGTGAAAARVRAGSPPRLVAVPGTGGADARQRPQPPRKASAHHHAVPPDRLQGSGGLGDARTPFVVFVGVADDVRSRLAATLTAYRSRGRVQAVSVSAVVVEPDPMVLRSLAQIGVDLEACRTQPPSSRLLEQADLVVVMGYDQLAADDRRTEDWCIDDPRGKDADAVRCIRDAIDRRVQRLLIRLGVAGPTRRPAGSTAS